MASSSTSPLEQRRLIRLLEAYRRDELWLRVNHVYNLGTQAPQVSFDALDGSGGVLRDRTGAIRVHTLQINSPTTRLVLDQLVYICREGDGVAVRILPFPRQTD